MLIAVCKFRISDSVFYLFTGTKLYQRLFVGLQWVIALKLVTFPIQ